MVASPSVLCLCVLLTSAVAAETYTLSKCVTQFAPTWVARVPTSFTATTITRTARGRKTTFPVTTVTPSPVTSSSTVFTTSTVTKEMNRTTITFSTTSTVLSTTTLSKVLTSTVAAASNITTTVSTTSTITVSPKAGFTPIGLQNPGSAKKRQIYGQAIQPRNGPAPCQLRPGWRRPDNRYPNEVDCFDKIIIVNTLIATVTGPTKTITAVPTLAQRTITSTITTTTTILENASVTSTAYVTSLLTTSTTLTSVTTTTGTATVSVAAPHATYYAACGPSNTISTQNSTYIGALESDSSGPQVLDASTAYDCCVSCINSADCGLGVYAQGNCFLFSSDDAADGQLPANSTCDASKTVATYGTWNAGVLGFTLSNGYCGNGLYDPSLDEL